MDMGMGKGMGMGMEIRMEMGTGIWAWAWGGRLAWRLEWISRRLFLPSLSSPFLSFPSFLYITLRMCVLVCLRVYMGGSGRKGKGCGK